MFKMMILIGAIIFGFESFAGDASSYQTLGFSKDGKYFAYAQTGVHDGSGFLFAEVTVKKVEYDTAVQTVVETVEDEMSNVDPLGLALKKVNLSAYGISLTQKGTELLARLSTDQSSYKDTKFSFPDDFMRAIPRELVLKEVKVKTNPGWCEEYGFDMAAHLSILSDKTGQSKTEIIKNDDRIPDSCAGNYGITRVIYHETSLVVIMSYDTVGFEGANTRFFAVTSNYVR